MKPYIIISIAGRCSESKNDIAESIKQVMLDKGYLWSNVSVSGRDNDDPYDGLSSDEIVEIKIV